MKFINRARELEALERAAAEGKAQVFALCVGAEDLAALERKAASVAWGKSDRREAFVYIGRSGFHPGAVRHARRRGMLLLSLADLQRSARAAGLA
jgi:hypothetical protein